MVSLQIVPRTGVDAYRLLRDKVTHQARTWSWKNKAKTRLTHKQNENGYIEVGRAEGVVLRRFIRLMKLTLTSLLKSSSGVSLLGFRRTLLQSTSNSAIHLSGCPAAESEGLLEADELRRTVSKMMLTDEIGVERQK